MFACKPSVLRDVVVFLTTFAKEHHVSDLSFLNALGEDRRAISANQIVISFHAFEYYSRWIGFIAEKYFARTAGRFTDNLEPLR